jgi:TetR/AcrR family transcriptional regulator
VQILQALAAMLEQPGAERVTTAALAARLEVSEAALYRHFASKAQMFEGLIDFIEQSVFTWSTRSSSATAPGRRPAGRRIVTMLVQFAEKNPGMTRVMVGDALVYENERLQQRMNQFFDKIEATLRQVLRGVARPTARPRPPSMRRCAHRALTAFVVGRLQRFARSGFPPRCLRSISKPRSH